MFWQGCKAPEVHDRFPECPELNGLGVWPPQRRSQGIGTAIIRAAETQAGRSGYHQIGLGVDDQNHRAAFALSANRLPRNRVPLPRPLPLPRRRRLAARGGRPLLVPDQATHRTAKLTPTSWRPHHWRGRRSSALFRQFQHPTPP
ncbi:GNAT family N-acetyltransferase [Streptomyces sp. NPDC047515]|uniref:GNAT family N-acetyltransferase n=1 Tax=Streptomyces sp. NPDC047515 TaxID=3155380 RepID=UPI0033DC913D